MYVTPTNLDQLSSWSSAWGDFLLEYAEVTAAHILNLLELRKDFPFSNRVIKKQLSIGQLQQIGIALVEKNFAAWWDERKTRLRVYWRGLDEWSDTIYEWAVQNGYDMVSLFELTNVGEIWSTMLDHDDTLSSNQDVNLLTHLARDIAVNDYQLTLNKNGVPINAGTPLDRNVILRFDVPMDYVTLLRNTLAPSTDIQSRDRFPRGAAVRK